MAARCRSFLPWLAASAVAVGLAACGSGGAGGGDAVAQAADVTAHQGIAQVHITGTVHVGGQAAPITGDGLIGTNPEQRLGRMSLTVNAAGRHITLHELFFQGAIYMGGGPFAGKIPGNKQWMKIDLFGLLKAEGADLSKLDSGAGNATQGLNYLRNAGDVSKVGTEPIHGVPTTHYHATIDMDKAFDRLKATKLKRVYDAQVGAGRKMPTDVWIDAKHRIRRYRMTMPMAQGTMDMTMDFVRFGVVLNLQKPPSSDVFDATGLVKKQLAAQGG
jgi:hypothetical protein